MNASAWLLTIARNLIVDHYRAQSRFRFVDLDNLAESEPALRTPADVAGVIYGCRSRMSGWLECMPRALRLEQKVAVLLADVHGYRDQESAVELRMSVPSFKRLLHGARARLQRFADYRCKVVGCRHAAAVCACDQPRPGTSHRRGPSALSTRDRSSRCGGDC